MKRLYAFDLDGTLIRSFLEKKDIPGTDGAATWARINAAVDYDEIELLPSRGWRLQELADDTDNCFAIITNQAGVAFGYQTAGQVWTKLSRVREWLLGDERDRMSLHVCFGHPEAPLVCDDVNRRKPNGTMLREAMDAHGVGWANTVYVGDLETDMFAAAAAGVQFIWEHEFFNDGPDPSPDPEPTSELRGDVLATANDLIHGERAKFYGDPRENLGMISEFWSAYLGRPVSSSDVCVMMTLLKCARQRLGHHRDSAVDIAGYAALMETVSRPVTVDSITKEEDHEHE